jgi:MtN3 and saliva related transmembrane protein
MSHFLMTLETALGLLAATLTTVAFVPQVVRAWRTRSTRDISLPMFAVLAVGIVLWLVYGVLIDDLPLIAANLVTLILVLAILFFKLRHK